MKLSVFMANYNEGHRLARALEALILQSRPPDEIVVVDDASTDNSVAVVTQWQQRFPALRLVRHEQHHGAWRAFRQLPQLVSGDYVYCAAADDYVLPGFFARALKAAEAFPRVGIIFGPMRIVDEDDKDIDVAGVPGWLGDRYVSPADFLTEYLERVGPAHALGGATIFRRAALAEAGWLRVDLGTWSDTFAARVAARRHGAYYLSQPCSVWTRDSRSLSQRSLAQPPVYFATLARAAQVQRSREYASLFPADFVRRWEITYRRWVIDQLLRSWLEHALVTRTTQSWQQYWYRRIYQTGVAGIEWLWRYWQPLGSHST